MKPGPERCSGRLVIEKVHKDVEDLKIDILDVAMLVDPLTVLRVTPGHVPHIKTH